MKLIKIPKDCMDIAIDIHMIGLHDRRPGEPLRRGKSKNGTSYFEVYITAHRVVPGMRLTPAVLSMHSGDAAAGFVPKITHHDTKNQDGLYGQGVPFGRDRRLSQ